MYRYYITQIVVLICALIMANKVIANNQTVHICNDDAQWPPYTFYQPGQSVDKKQLTGISVDILNILFKQAGMKYKMQLLPWSRCLNEVKHFDKSRKFEMFIDGTANQERRSFAYLSTPVYATNEYIFFNQAITSSQA